MEIQMALSKARHFCNYQERSAHELESKLREWKVEENHYLEIVETLTTEGLLDELRFAKAYARGKFRLNHWGKVKIRQGLKMKGISSALVEEGLKEIDDDDYLLQLQTVLRKKLSASSTKNPLQMKHAAATFAAGQGFEPSLVWENIKMIIQEDTE